MLDNLKFWGFLTLVAALQFTSVRESLAVNEQPTKAKKAQFQLINGQPRCTVADSGIDGTGVPTCLNYPTSACRFGPDGSGKLTIMQVGKAPKNLGDDDTRDIAIKVVAKGLIDCESQLLHPTIEATGFVWQRCGELLLRGKFQEC